MCASSTVLLLLSSRFALRLADFATDFHSAGPNLPPANPLCEPVDLSTVITSPILAITAAPTRQQAPPSASVAVSSFSGEGNDATVHVSRAQKSPFFAGACVEYAKDDGTTAQFCCSDLEYETLHGYCPVDTVPCFVSLENKGIIRLPPFGTLDCAAQIKILYPPPPPPPHPPTTTAHCSLLSAYAHMSMQ